MATRWILFLVLFVPWLLIEGWLFFVWASDPGARETMGTWALIDWSIIGLVFFGVLGLLDWFL